MKPNLFLSFLILSVFVGTVFGGTYSGGNGTEFEPYLINDANDMNEIGATSADWGSYFLLTADIDMSMFTGTQFNIIGNSAGNAFTGVFDGNEHTISNFTYTATGISHNIGLFSYVNSASAEIKDLTLISPDVNVADSDQVGSLVGWMLNGTIIDCGLEGGSVSGHSEVGGLVGRSHGEISNCYATGSVSSVNQTGGLAGVNAGAISNCYATGSTSSGQYTGGLVGSNGSGATISNCYSAGSVSGTDDTGGLVGNNSNFSEISDCYATGPVYGNDSIGSLVGWNNNSNISNSYATGLAQGNSQVGGLVGENDGFVNDSFFDIDTGGPDNSIGIPQTTEQMKTVSTFYDVGWDLVTTWNIEELQTYPLLRRYLAVDLNYDHRVNFIDLAKFIEYWLEGVE